MTTDESIYGTSIYLKCKVQPNKEEKKIKYKLERMASQIAHRMLLFFSSNNSKIESKHLKIMTKSSICRTKHGKTADYLLSDHTH